MRNNARFAVAVHILAFVAVHRPATPNITSAMIAKSVNTNPVVIRRLLGLLRKARLVASQPGCGGGWTLAQPAESITLAQIYAAVKDAPLFAVHHRPPNARCEVGRSMISVLNTYFTQAEDAIAKQWQVVTLDQIARAILARAKTAPGVAQPVRTLARTKLTKMRR